MSPAKPRPFSHRAAWHAPKNRLTLARERRGAELLDLTASNPTRAQIDYPLDELAEVMARAARAPYTPDPLGLRTAREALAERMKAHPDDIVLTASTSEAYSFLFKLLCDAEDEVVTAVPSYPLIEEIAALDLVTVCTAPLEFHRRWEIDGARLRAGAGERARAIVAVNPNNPTGSFLDANDRDEIASCGLPLICDEVFLDYGVERTGTSFSRDDVRGFTLDGLSKSAGLPHYKLGWIRVLGPVAWRREATAALAVIADHFLSAATPVQIALPDLLRMGTRMRAAISERIRGNLRALDEALAATPSAQRLPVEGGWSAVVRIPSTISDEEFAVRLVETHGVLVHPGYFFDFPSEGFFVVSLLTEPQTFDAGVRRFVDMIPKG